MKAVILLEGINDIGFSAEPDTGCFAPNDSTITAAHIEAGYLQLIKMAHASGVKIFAGTLAPFLGSNCRYGGNFGTPQGEALRQSVNQWILTGHAFDGVVDFDRATASPYNSQYLNAAYNATGSSACQAADKTLLTEVGGIDLDVPRDRDGSFQPRIVRKGQTPFAGLDGEGRAQDRSDAGSVGTARVRNRVLVVLTAGSTSVSNASISRSSQ